MSAIVRAAASGLVLCRTCGLVSPHGLADEGTRCARCSRPLFWRMPRSKERTLAWLVAGILLYLPANILPAIHTSGVGGEQDSTILDGVVSFWRAGSWDIAALIFTASVLVPITKFLVLGLLLGTVWAGSTWAQTERAKLCRLVEFIGYWSMLDVVVVALTSALLQFKALGTAEPRLGIVFFCGVVVATMFSALSFDPRLIWDR